MTADDLRRLMKFNPFVQSLAGHGIRPFSDLHEASPGLRYYTFVRDPVQRTFSTFKARLYNRGRKQGLPKSRSALRDYFIQTIHEHANWQTGHLANVADAEQAIDLIRSHISFVGVLERFDESLVLLRKWMQPDTLDITHNRLNISANRRWRNQLAAEQGEQLRLVEEGLPQLAEDGALLSLIRELNGEDTLLYRYVTEVTYPALTADYGDGLAADVSRFRERLAATKCRFNDALTGKFYRNFVLKPASRWLFPRAA
jgi:hypothetical protein